MKNNKFLGQHWLKNRAILDEIADLAAGEDSISKSPDSSSSHSVLNSSNHNLSPSTTKMETVCLEIGPGLGTLTSSLLKRFSKVIAVEYDERLAGNLPKSFPGKNLQVIHDDILSVNIPELVHNDNYVVVGNIPYYITSPIVRRMLELSPSPLRIVLLMQKEVAERIAAESGDHSLLSLTVQNQATVELGPIVRATEFTPPPKVDSQVLILTPLSNPQIDPTILDFAKKGFVNPRKKLSANLADGHTSKTEWEGILRSLSINPDSRAEDLDLWDWEELYKVRLVSDSW